MDLSRIFITDHAIEFIEREHEANESPFFCYVPYNTPHTPASVPVDKWRQWADRTDVEDPFDRAMYALVENVDENMGRLLAKLEALENLGRNGFYIPDGQRPEWLALQ